LHGWSRRLLPLASSGAKQRRFFGTRAHLAVDNRSPARRSIRPCKGGGQEITAGPGPDPQGHPVPAPTLVLGIAADALACGDEQAVLADKVC
jgi:hypothetical protein